MIDLHLHTRYSDGELLPAELIPFVSAFGIKVIAVTDHDSINGLPEVLAAGRAGGVAVIPGVELTTSYKGDEIHVLGYGIDYENRTLRKELSRLRTARCMRIKRMLAKLRDLGVVIHDRDVFNGSENGSMLSEQAVAYGRPHLARVLQEKGYVTTFKEAFDRYIGNDSPAYVSKECATTIQGIQLLKRAGGIVVIAHPEDNVKEEDIDIFKQNGLDGIEAFCPAHDEMQAYHYELMAQRKGLICTTGTDMHASKGYQGKMEKLNRDPRFIAALASVMPEIGEAVQI